MEMVPEAKAPEVKVGSPEATMVLVEEAPEATTEGPLVVKVKDAMVATKVVLKARVAVLAVLELQVMVVS